MSTRPPRPTVDRCLGRAAADALSGAAPVDVERLAAAILASDLADLELRIRLGMPGADPTRNA